MDVKADDEDVMADVLYDVDSCLDCCNDWLGIIKPYPFAILKDFTLPVLRRCR